MRRYQFAAVGFLAILPLLAAYVGASIGGGILHPMRLNRMRLDETQAMLARTGATKEDFTAAATDGVQLRGWKVRPPAPNGDWVLLYHGVSDNCTGDIGHAEFLLRHGYSLVMMDARAHGESGGDMATYGWKERHDTVAVTNVLYSSEKVRHLYALGVSMGAAIALQSAAIEPRIEAVVAEAPFANLREVSYDYAGLHAGSWLGKSLFRPASMAAMHSVEKEGGFKPEDVSPEQAVAERPLPVLLICGTRDSTIPCRHSRRVYKAATGPKEFWIVRGAGPPPWVQHRQSTRRASSASSESIPRVPVQVPYKSKPDRSAGPFPAGFHFGEYAVYQALKRNEPPFCWKRG